LETLSLEIGYAIGKEKPIRLIRNSTVTHFLSIVDRVGIFDTLGWIQYENCDKLAEYLCASVTSAKSQDIYFKYNRRAPIFLLDTKQKTDLAIAVNARVKKEIVSFRSFDPQETARLSAHEAISSVASSSFGVVVSLLPEEMPDAEEHNIRASFIAGLAAGMPREVLLLQLGEGAVPLDFRDVASVCRRPEQIAEALHEFAPRIMEGYQRDLARASRSGRTVIQDLNLGASVAENEFRDLQSYYLEVDAFHRALRGEVRVVLGRKGSGKTALFARLRDEKREKKQNVVVDIKPEGYKLIKFKEDVLEFLQLGTLEHTITAFWEYVLLIEIAYKLLEKDRNIYGRDARIYQPYIELQQQYAESEHDSTGDFSERMSRLLNDIRLEIQRRHGKGANIRLSNAEITEIVHKHPIAKLRHALVKYVRTKESVWVLVDNIDKGWPTHGVEKEDLMLVRTLLDAAWKVERSVEDADVECKTVVFLRNDVYELLVEHTPDRGKLTKALVDWTDQAALKQLLRRRLIFSGLDPDLNFEDMWARICVPGVRGQDSAEFILERCLMRPRALLNAIAHIRGTAVNRGHQIMEADDIIAGLKTYSHDLVEEISLEIRDVAPNIENAVYLLLGCSENLSHEELEIMFIEEGIEDGRLSLWFRGHDMQ
jgi:hypothetical protein